MAVYREFRMGGSQRPFGFLGPLLMLILFFVFLYYIAKGMFTILSWASPVLLLGALLFDYRVVTAYLKWIWQLLGQQPFIGLLMVAATVLAYPFVAAYLFFKALTSSNQKRTTSRGNQQSYTHHGSWQETTEDIEYEEVDSSQQEGQRTSSRQLP